MLNIKKIVISLLFTIFFLSPINLYAQTIDVTETKASEMEQLIDDISFIPMVNLCYGDKKLSFNTITKSTMAAVLSTQTTTEKVSLSLVKKDMKQLFGTSSFKLATNGQYPYSLFKQKGSIVYCVGGDWGNASPYFKIKKVIQTSKGTYLCSINYYINYSRQTDYIGNFSYVLKSANNPYGYIITGITQNTKCGYRKTIKYY